MMSDRSGIGLVELSALETLETLTAGRTRVFPGSDKVLAEIEDRIGLGPRYAYDVLLDLARPWRVPVRLVDFQGGSGDRHFPADDPEYARCRLSLAGQLALDAEAHRLAPVPAGLINGTTYRGGTRPPPGAFPGARRAGPAPRRATPPGRRDPRHRRTTGFPHRLRRQRGPRRPGGRPGRHAAPGQPDNSHR